MRFLRLAILAFAGASFLAATESVCLGQQRVYAYTDDQGVRIFTNIPPKNAKLPDQPVLDPGGRGAAPSGGNPNDKAQVDTIIDKYKDHYRLDPDLVRAIIATESAFNPNAVSRKGARGLMQLMPSTASRLGVRNPFDPEENIRGGMEHLRFLLDTFNDDVTLSLAAYNAGENLIQRINRVPDYPETKAYVRSVKSRYGRKGTGSQSTLNVPRGPSTFKWVDSQGILHMTNIAPTLRSDANWGSLGSAVQSLR